MIRLDATSINPSVFLKTFIISGSIDLGLMLIVMKGEIISLAITLLGVTVLISAISDFANSFKNAGIIKAVIALCILVFGWVFVNLALYILAAAIIIMGLLQIANINEIVSVNLTVKDKALIYRRTKLCIS